MIEEQLKKILATEAEADKIEADARAEAEKIIADAHAKAKELIAQAEARAQRRLQELRAQAEADGKAEAERLTQVQEKLLQRLRKRYNDLHTKVVKEADLDLASILALAKE
jgi:vacuolar-type H+-ATPase subunit H